MKVKANGLRKLRRQHLVFQHLHRHAHQRQGVRVVAVVFTGYVQRPHELPMWPKNGGTCAGQGVVGLHKVFGPLHGDGLAFLQRGANGVGALGLF